MDKEELFERIKKDNGNTIVLGFSNGKAVNATISLALELGNEDRIIVNELTRNDDFSVTIKAYVK
ncbi:hypothetical protein ACIQ4I_12370 [Rummeliibacillus sp. NPDC094406]|uniref:hypothetical protein n=1 Tax=Rummeliibacillus sp. NPDC094406 TaxID=3364511 RepID=UPI0037F2F05A